MKHLYMDTSALVKHYHKEAGTNVVNRLMAMITSDAAKGIITSLTLTEIISAINKKKNDGFIGQNAFDKIISIFYEELKYFKILPINEQKIVSSIPYILKYSLNSADALHLANSLSERFSIDPDEGYFFVCCDKRLLVAAKKEKLATINPEEIGDDQISKLMEREE